MSGLAWETAHLCAWDTGLTADSVEAVPSALGFRGFACSTYQLDPATGQRHGSVTLLRVCIAVRAARVCNACVVSRAGCTQVADDASMLAPQCTLSCAGVLDAKWGTRHPVLAAACADATLRIVATNEARLFSIASLPACCTSHRAHQDGTELRVLAEHDWQDASLCLSVVRMRRPVRLIATDADAAQDWDDRAALGASPARVAVSHSNGYLSRRRARRGAVVTHGCVRFPAGFLCAGWSRPDWSSWTAYALHPPGCAARTASWCPCSGRRTT